MAKIPYVGYRTEYGNAQTNEKMRCDPMKKMPWVKLATGLLRDEKIHFIIKKYGHDTMVVWTGLLTECNRGVLEMDEEIFAEVCIMDIQRFDEIKKIFIKFELVTQCNGEKLSVTNWEKYQYSDSYERVKAHREKKSQEHVTDEKQKVTIDIDIDIDIDTDKKISPRKFSDDDLAIANLIHAKLLEIDQKAKTPNFDKWADDIRMMRERDKRTPEEIKAVFMFANQDSFWRTNILSPGKLREKFTTLLAKKAQVENAANQHNPRIWQNGYDNRSRAKRVADTLDAIAVEAVTERGSFADRVD